jgi:hypothetical protein
MSWALTAIAMVPLLPVVTLYGRVSQNANMRSEREGPYKLRKNKYGSSDYRNKKTRRSR